MTGNELFNQALLLTGYGGTTLVDSSDITSRALGIINTIYSELYFLNKNDGFEKLGALDETLNLGERELNDCAVYGVCAFLAKLLGSDDDYNVFSSIYNYKKAVVMRKSRMDKVVDTFNVGEC